MPELIPERDDRRVCRRIMTEARGRALWQLNVAVYGSIYVWILADGRFPQTALTLQNVLKAASAWELPTVDSPQLTGRLLLDTLRLLIGLVPALAGTIHHLVPFAITRGLVQLVKNPGRATLALSRFVISVPVYAVWYAFVWWWLTRWTQVWIAWLWIALMPLAGVAALHYAWRLRYAGRAWWQELRMVLRPAQLRQLRIGQVHLRRQLEQLRAEYRAAARR